MSQTIDFQKSALETLRVEQQALDVLAAQIDHYCSAQVELL